LVTPAVTTIDTDESISRAWRSHLVALGAVLALILVEFRGAISAALTVWRFSPTYSHCFLIIPIVGWLIWEKRDVLAKTRPAVEPRILLLVLPLLALWWFGELSAVNEVRQYAVVGLMQIAIIALIGPKIVRQIWFPVLFLLFLVPTGEYLIGPMQQFATRFVDTSLNILGIPHYTEGTVIELTNGRFEIAEACAGLRFLIATVTLGVLFAYLMYQRIYKIVLFLLASVIIPLIGNGLRCVGIILLAHYTNNEYGAGADHIVYGWGFNVAILLVLIFVGSLFRDEPKHLAPAEAPVAGRQDAVLAIAAVAALAAILISAGPAWALWREHGSATLDRNVIENALESAGWRNDEPTDNWRPFFPEADARFLQERDVVEPVNLFIGYYVRPRAGRSVIAHLNRPWDDNVWNASSGAQVKAKLGTASVKLNEVIINSGSRSRLVWFTYWADGTITNNPLLVRLLQAKAALSGHEGQAVIVVSTPLDVPVDEARSRLGVALSFLGSVSAALRDAETGPHENQRAS
jgi:exosortase A